MRRLDALVEHWGHADESFHRRGHKVDVAIGNISVPVGGGCRFVARKGRGTWISSHTFAS